MCTNIWHILLHSNKYLSTQEAIATKTIYSNRFVAVWLSHLLKLVALGQFVTTRAHNVLAWAAQST
jgi:hypothetical protein